MREAKKTRIFMERGMFDLCTAISHTKLEHLFTVLFFWKVKNKWVSDTNSLAHCHWFSVQLSLFDIVDNGVFAGT